MLKKFLKEVVVIVVGKQAEEIADLLNTKKYVNEFLIAKKLEITINQTRNILYKILDYGLVSSIRKKDKRKGWYTYFWKIEVLKSLKFLRSTLVKKINQINYQIKSRETKEFYICERCNIEFNEENALLYDFTCSECGNIFTIKDNTKVLREFKRNLDKLNKELELVNQEIEKEKEKIEKSKLKEIKKKEKLKIAAKKKTAKKKKKPIKKVAKRKKGRGIKKKKMKGKLKKKKEQIKKKLKKKIKKRVSKRIVKRAGKKTKKVAKKKVKKKPTKKIKKKKISKKKIKKSKTKKKK